MHVSRWGESVGCRPKLGHISGTRGDQPGVIGEGVSPRTRRLREESGNQKRRLRGNSQCNRGR